RPGQLALQIQSAQTRQPDVQDEAARYVRPLSSEELLRRGEGLNAQSDRLDELLRGVSDRRLIVHHIDDSLIGVTMNRHGSPPICRRLRPLEVAVNSIELGSPGDHLPSGPGAGSAHAALIASSNATLLKGFSKKSTAPASSARARTSSSACAEMKMIGTSQPDATRRRWSSSPSIPGMRTSSIRQVVLARDGEARNSSALANAS